jgi:hypothetical protein
MTDHLTYSLLVPGLVKGCTRPQGQARDTVKSIYIRIKIKTRITLLFFNIIFSIKY